jgi:hypothetical protein
MDETRLLLQVLSWRLQNLPEDRSETCDSKNAWIGFQLVLPAGELQRRIKSAFAENQGTLKKVSVLFE